MTIVFVVCIAATLSVLLAVAVIRSRFRRKKGIWE